MLANVQDSCPNPSFIDLISQMDTTPADFNTRGEALVPASGIVAAWTSVKSDYLVPAFTWASTLFTEYIAKVREVFPVSSRYILTPWNAFFDLKSFLERTCWTPLLTLLQENLSERTLGNMQLVLVIAIMIGILALIATVFRTHSKSLGFKSQAAQNATAACISLIVLYTLIDAGLLDRYEPWFNKKAKATRNWLANSPLNEMVPNFVNMASSAISPPVLLFLGMSGGVAAYLACLLRPEYVKGPIFD